MGFFEQQRCRLTAVEEQYFIVIVLINDKRTFVFKFIKFKIVDNFVDCLLNIHNWLHWTCALRSCFDTLSGARLFFELLGAETVRIFNLLVVHCSLLL